LIKNLNAMISGIGNVGQSIRSNGHTSKQTGPPSQFVPPHKGR
jgi:hypothetical protein